jgi:hypothetical protein
MDLETANAFLMTDVFNNAGTQSFYTASSRARTNGSPAAPVLCDVYSRQRKGQEGNIEMKRTGMPILYFRARTSWTFQDATDTQANLNDVYNLADNYKLLLLGTADSAKRDHFLADGGGGGAIGTGATEADIADDDLMDFERMVLNTKISVTGVKKPYREGSYILISAGKDGIYGTGDDITNFSSSVKE